ncbi:hypothetical protein BST97_06680 [Nonlabens spongiae]|uniref:Uncharacterized protein n=1 Tax=Nonlabens spongiae TaxID=331648 RepID=A0A1W6MJG2_9FLAO|nr:hypothetical protein BST97_06680 [Nonlabens spongiae]
MLSKITSFGILKAIHNPKNQFGTGTGVVKDHIFWNSESNSQQQSTCLKTLRVVKDHIFWNSDLISWII